ncbi:MAG: bifunctional phosphoribosylaminoimidazolecarboxamide formyltransferase/IMP cyclohydrolase [Candidatus Omnitrophica bacterium]|nr:bifunctional phosphoribosylaminoimidazolecarboxamide formyltransferase/IMP cyclohydrolase [Candidatus Omnitrophota bacterium]
MRRVVRIKRALISVSDKSGLDDLVKVLNDFKVEMISTGGTAKQIAQLGIPVKSVSDITQFPEMLDGRVKTLHPKIHGGLLALRDNPEHLKQVEEFNIEFIDMVVVNLYPFEKTVSDPSVEFEQAIENIDIGGPSMLRSAAKNSRSVAVICNPERYKDIIKELKENNGALSLQTRTNLAAEVFKRTYEYDRAIAEYLQDRIKPQDSGNQFAEKPDLRFEKVQDLRYGENPHQKAAFYRQNNARLDNIANARQLHGKELSFNNIIDLNAALNIVKDFQVPTASIVKHTNPCGAASADKLSLAYKNALDCDPMSAFGSIVGFNRKVEVDTAQEILSADFVECIIGPGFSSEALSILKQKKNLRIMQVADFMSLDQDKLQELDYKRVSGGLLVQQNNIKILDHDNLKVVTTIKPTQEQMKALLFSWTIVKHVKSNAIVLGRETKTVGIGAGQMSRVDSVIIALRKAGSRSHGAVLASDAFFPKADSIEQAAKAGICAIIQPGGSIRDQEVINAAEKAQIAMVLTGMRHFCH